MRIIIIITALLLSSISGNAIATETGLTHRAMLYLDIPLDGTESDRQMARFGFRFDNVEYTKQGVSTYYSMDNPVALMDFRMNRYGIEGIYFSGTDYLQKYKVNRQNQQQDSDEEESVETTISEAMKAAPLGVYIGIGLGVGLLLGVGD